MARFQADLDRCAGLIFGFHFQGEAVWPVADETLSGALDVPHDWLWLHLALFDQRARIPSPADTVM
jgi:hypothetical protein